ncbi:MAG: hypothetical protein QOD43_414 [Gaiellaceae bacterium]|jgi:DUF4097 and DUF4098 domain-containing protein YvlB|nr:hypothetical protein [Gaiellaceae bacterium]
MRRETFAAQGPLRLDLSLPAGEIELEAVPGGETVVELELLRGSEAAVEEARVELRGDELIVKVDHPNAEVRLRLQVPEGSTLQAKTASGDVRARGRLGDAEVKSASGDVQLEAVGSLDAKIASGDLEVAQVAGDARVDSASGDVDLGEAGGGVTVRTASGDQLLRSVVDGKVELASASGDIRVGIKQGSRLWVDARSMSGEVTSELEVGDEVPEEDGPLVELKVTAMSGDVEVVRA